LSTNFNVVFKVAVFSPIFWVGRGGVVNRSRSKLDNFVLANLDESTTKAITHKKQIKKGKKTKQKCDNGIQTKL
jgi:hypothetical protein